MQNVIGFTTIDSLIDNTVDTTSVLGELSGEARSYSTDITTYRHDTNKEFTFHCFKRMDEDGKIVDIEPAILTDILAVSNWLFTAGKDGTITNDKEIFLNNFQREFPSIGDTYDCGEIRAASTYYLPEWVSFKQGNTRDVRIYLSDPVFRLIYGPYKLRVISPTTSLDDLHLDQETVQRIVSGRSLGEWTRLINETKADNPFTTTHVESLLWHDKTDDRKTVKTDFMLLQYGPRAQDPENIRQAIIDYIIANSKFGEVDWQPIYPDLFDPTIIRLIPMWDNIAIPDRTITEGRYSAVVKFHTDVTRIKGLTEFTLDHCLTTGETVPTRFECLAMVSIGSPKNKKGMDNFYNIFPDYLPVAMEGPDWNSMSLQTQAGAELIGRMLMIGEKFRVGDPLPSDIKTMIREGRIYLVSKYLDASFQVITKESYLDTLAGA